MCTIALYKLINFVFFSMYHDRQLKPTARRRVNTEQRMQILSNLFRVK